MSTDTDVLIVGTGIMGAIVARQIREQHRDATITMVDAGPPIGTIVGQHMHDSPEDEVRTTYNRRVSGDLQPLYVGPEFHDHGGDLRSLPPGMYRISAFGEDATHFPGAALAWNVGGMSVHWTAATPIPWGSEVFDWGDASGWERDLTRAMSLLRVNRDPSGVSGAGRRILAALGARYRDRSAPGREPQTLPMAIDSSGSGRWPRTGPSTVLPALRDHDDPHLQILGRRAVVEVIHDRGLATAVRTRRLDDGAESTITARYVVVCADALRTPQLLFASGIRPDALGRRLNEHAFLAGRAHPALDAMGVREADLPPIHPGEWRVGGYWVPHNDARQPFNGEVSEKYAAGIRSAEDYVLSLTWYVATEIDPRNRVIFSETEQDAMGMPRMSFEFSYSERDRAAIAAALAEMHTVAEALGSPPAQTAFAALEPGASLHYTGTVRTGASDDGTSVADRHGRVWGWENLFVAGNGAIPTAVLCNTTLTGAVTAVRTGAELGRLLTASSRREI